MEAAYLVLHEGWTVSNAAEDFGVSWATASSWVDRFRESPEAFETVLDYFRPIYLYRYAEIQLLLEQVRKEATGTFSKPEVGEWVRRLALGDPEALEEFAREYRYEVAKANLAREYFDLPEDEDD